MDWVTHHLWPGPVSGIAVDLSCFVDGEKIMWKQRKERRGSDALDCWFMRKDGQDRMPISDQLDNTFVVAVAVVFVLVLVLVLVLLELLLLLLRMLVFLMQQILYNLVLHSLSFSTITPWISVSNPGKRLSKPIEKRRVERGRRDNSTTFIKIKGIK